MEKLSVAEIQEEAEDFFQKVSQMLKKVFMTAGRCPGKKQSTERHFGVNFTFSD